MNDDDYSEAVCLTIFAMREEDGPSVDFGWSCNDCMFTRAELVKIRSMVLTGIDDAIERSHD